MVLQLLPSIGIQSRGGARARPPPFHHNRHKREQTEPDKCRYQLRRKHIRRVEDHLAIVFAGGDALVKRIFLRRNHAVESHAGQCKYEDCRDDTDHGCGNEWPEPHARKGRHEIDQEKWKHRHQPQKEEIAEGIFAKPFCKLPGARTGPAQQRLAKGRPRNEENERSANGRADRSGRCASHKPE